MTVHSDPAQNAAAVTPSDSTVINARALWVGTGGNVAVDMLGQVGFSNGASAVVFTNVPSGTLLPISVARVRSTSTTASGIVALY